MIQTDDCILVMGTRGCGKSFLARNIQKLFPRRIIFDTLNEYPGETIHSFDELCFKLEDIERNNISDFELIYQFDPESDDAVIEFDQAMRLAYYLGNLQIVIEEVQEFSGPHNLPKWLRNCLLKGRHRNISVLCTTQRPGELNKTILSQSRHIFCGNLIEGNDLRYISSFLGQNSESLTTLPPRQFIYFSPKGITQISNDF